MKEDASWRFGEALKAARTVKSLRKNGFLEIVHACADHGL